MNLAIATRPRDVVRSRPSVVRVAAAVGALWCTTMASPSIAAQSPSLPTPPLCPAPNPRGLLIHFLDVGQGDATLLTSSDGRHVLVDGGPRPTQANTYLTALRVDSVTLMVATHNHLDHIGGLPTILDSRPVANVMENGLPTTTRIYANFLTAIERSRARVLRAEARELTIGTLQLRILPPSIRNRSQNLASIGVIATHGAFRLLITGDAETQAVDAWTSQGAIPAVTVVKVGHHGSSNATTPALVATTRPRLAVISVGADNTYKHPDAGVITRWSGSGARVLRTDTDGTIVVRGCADGSYTLATASPARRAGTE